MQIETLTLTTKSEHLGRIVDDLSDYPISQTHGRSFYPKEELRVVILVQHASNQSKFSLPVSRGIRIWV